MKVFRVEVIRQWIADLRTSHGLLRKLQKSLLPVAVATTVVLVLRSYPSDGPSKIRAACDSAIEVTQGRLPVKGWRCVRAAVPEIWSNAPVGVSNSVLALLLFPLFRGMLGWIISLVIIPRVVIRKKAEQPPRLVVTLVHGTFAADAQWTKAGEAVSPTGTGRHSDPHRLVASILSDVCCLERELTLDNERRPLRLPADREDREIYALEWTGENCHAARRQAADALRSHLEYIESTYPEALQVIVAHSHGGNVAMYALRDCKVATPPAVVTLSTPFLQKRNRDTEMYPWGTRNIPIALLTMLTAYGCTWLGAVLLKVFVPLDLSVRTHLDLAFWVFFGLLIVTFAVWARQAPRVQKEIAFGRFDSERLLIVRTPGDEAGALLAVALLISILVGVGKGFLLKVVSIPYDLRLLIERKVHHGASLDRKVRGAAIFSLQALTLMLFAGCVVRGLRENANVSGDPDAAARAWTLVAAACFLYFYFGLRMELFLARLCSRLLERSVVLLEQRVRRELPLLREVASSNREVTEVLWKDFLRFTGRHEGAPVAALQWFVTRLLLILFVVPLVTYAIAGVDKQASFALLFSWWSAAAIATALLLFFLAVRLDDTERCIRWLVACVSSIFTRLAEGISVLPIGVDLLPVTLLVHVTPEPTPVGTVTAYTDDAAEGETLMHSRAYSDAGICYAVCHQIHEWMKEYPAKTPAAGASTDYTLPIPGLEPVRTTVAR